MTDTGVKIPASDLKPYILRWMAGTYTIWCGGSAGAAERCARHPGVPEFETAYGDIDFFCTSGEALLYTASMLVQRGALTLNDNEERKLHRWLRFGMGSFSTQSLRMQTLDEVEFNLVFKTQDGAALRTPFQVVNSFDFSNVSMATDMRTGVKYDLARTYWPGHDPDHVVWFPDREEQWRSGSITRHTGVRQAKRYAVNVRRWWDMTRTKDVLVEGYSIVGAHYRDKEDDELQAYADVYLALAQLVDQDDIDGIEEIFKDVSPHTKIEKIREKVLMP